MNSNDFIRKEKIIAKINPFCIKEHIKLSLIHNRSTYLNLRDGTFLMPNAILNSYIAIYKLQEKDKLKSDICNINYIDTSKIFNDFCPLYGEEWECSNKDAKEFCKEKNILIEDFNNRYITIQSNELYKKINMVEYINKILDEIEKKYEKEKTIEKFTDPFKRIFGLKEEIIQFTPIEKVIELVKRQKWIEVFKRGLKHNTNIVLNLYHGNVSTSEIENPFDVFLFKLKEDDKLKTDIASIFHQTFDKIFKILRVYAKWKDAGLYAKAFCFENNITKEEFFNAYAKTQAEDMYNNIHVTNYTQEIISKIKQKYDEIDKNEYIGRNIHKCIKDIIANKINIDQIKFILTNNTKAFMRAIATSTQKYPSEEEEIMTSLYKQNKIIFLEDSPTWIKI